MFDALGIGLRLASDAATHSGDSAAPGLGDLLAAVLAELQALSLGKAAPCAGDRVLDARVYLVLYGSVASPTDGHRLLLPAK